MSGDVCEGYACGDYFVQFNGIVRRKDNGHLIGRLSDIEKMTRVITERDQSLVEVVERIAEDDRLIYAIKRLFRVSNQDDSYDLALINLIKDYARSCM